MKKKYLFILSLIVCYYANQITFAQVTLVRDINPGSYNSQPMYMTNVNGIVYFYAQNGIYGSSGDGGELYRSNGTSGGTYLVKDINAGTTGSTINALTNVNEVAFFSASTSATGQELFKSNGTRGGTVLVKDINPGSSNGMENVNTRPVFISFKNKLYFQATNGTNGMELWSSDGTSGGTEMVLDINPGSGNSLKYPFFTICNDSLFFIADDGGGVGQLWKTDGTTSGTKKASTMFINNNYAGTTLGIASPDLYAFNNVLYIDAGNKLLTYDESGNGAVILHDFFPGGRIATDAYFCNNGSEVFFAAYTDATGQELWKTNGTDIGTVMVKDIAPGSSYSSPRDLINYNGIIIFTAYESSTGEELWKSDGTSAGTELVKDIYSGTSAGMRQGIILYNNAIYFAAKDATNGTELWKTDGTAAGTTMVSDLGYSTNDAFVGYLCVSNGALFFSASGSNGIELYKLTALSTGLSYISSSDLFSIYPNPASGLIKIKNESGAINQIQIMKITGEIVLSESYDDLLNERSVDIEKLENSIYLINVISEDKNVFSRISINR